MSQPSLRLKHVKETHAAEIRNAYLIGGVAGFLISVVLFAAGLAVI